MGSTSNSTKPLVLIGCTGITGHVLPIRAVAKDLISRGYEVTFVSVSHFRKSLEEIGCTYVPVEGYGDFWDGEIDTKFPNRRDLPPGPLQLAHDVEMCFIRVIPDQHAAMQRALKMLAEKYPGRPVVQISEAGFQGALPITQGAEGIKPTATLGLGVIPMTLSSIDCAPFGPGILPDSSPEGRMRNQAMQKHIELFFTQLKAVLAEMYEQTGTKLPAARYADAPYLLVDRFLQMCIPSAEYPRSDAPSTIQFTGGLPRGSRDPMINPPTWWHEVIENEGKKDIIFVCQGTFALDYSDLIIPTMAALQNRPNTLVIVAVGKKGGSLPEGTAIPANARVADFLPFDEILPHSRVFISNGGYGAFQHSISHGIPLLVAGAGEDKPEIAARAEWSGMAVNLCTGRPAPEAILKGVEDLIANPRYKARALEMQAEMASFDPMEIVARAIEDLAAGNHLQK